MLLARDDRGERPHLLCSSSPLPPSPPTEKATARQDQARHSGTHDGAWNWIAHRNIGEYESQVLVVEVRISVGGAIFPSYKGPHPIKPTGRLMGEVAV